MDTISNSCSACNAAIPCSMVHQGRSSGGGGSSGANSDSGESRPQVVDQVAGTQVVDQVAGVHVVVDQVAGVQVVDQVAGV